MGNLWRSVEEICGELLVRWRVEEDVWDEKEEHPHHLLIIMKKKKKMEHPRHLPDLQEDQNHIVAYNIRKRAIYTTKWI